MTNDKKLLSVVVSVYNEAETLERFHEAFSKVAAGIYSAGEWELELLYVDDGSTDDSPLYLESFVNGNEPSKGIAAVRVVTLSRNFGHEAAMIAGIDHASGDGVVCMDADLQHPVLSLVDIAARLSEGYDVINMVRKRNRGAGIIRNLLSHIFYKLVNSLSRDVCFEEDASDFFAVSRRVADILRKNYREKNRFLRGYVQSVGFRKTVLRYEAAPRVAGHSHYSFGGLMRFSVNAMVCFSDLPIRLGIYMGAFAGLCGLIVLIYTLCTREGAPSGYATVVVLICFMFALMFIVVGIVGEYIAIMFAELKDRPVYLVARELASVPVKKDGNGKDGRPEQAGTCMNDIFDSN